MGQSRFRPVLGPAGVTFLSILSFTFVFPLYPYLQEHYGISTLMISIAAALAALPQIVLAPMLGLAQDRFGRRAVLLPCLAVWVIGAAVQVIGLASGEAVYPLFLVGRLLQAVGDAGFFQTALSLVADEYQGGPRLNWAMALVESSASTGGIVGPMLTAAVLSLGAWAPSLITGLIGLALLIFMAGAVPPRRAGDAAPVARQLRSALPLLRNPLVLGTYLTGLLCMYTLQGVQTFLGFLLRDRFGLGTGGQGLLLAVVPWAMVLGAQLTPMLQRRISRAVLLPVSLTSCILLFGVLSLPLGRFGLTVGLIIGGTVLGAILPLGNGMLAAHGDSAVRGMVMALFGSARLLGSLVAPLLIGAFLSTGYATAYGVGGTVGGALAVIAVVLLRSRTVE